MSGMDAAQSIDCKMGLTSFDATIVYFIEALGANAIKIGAVDGGFRSVRK